jgi:archaellum component FlaC
MSDAPDNVVLILLRRIDERVGRMAEDVHDLKLRMTGVESDLGHVRVSLAGVNARIDRVEGRLDRIERRLDLIDAPAA